MIGKHETKLYRQIVSMIESGSTPREIRMTTGSPDSYVSLIRKSLKDPK